MAKQWRNRNGLWAEALVESLRRKGARHAVCCPGSRNSPLLAALATCEGIEALPALDERSAAFFALGLAKRSGRPVVLCCTSGSAVANFLPAVVEASESAVPLIILSADRPPRLQDCGAGQTIDQSKLFGAYARKFRQLGMPGIDLQSLRYLREAVSVVADASMAPDRGPVHLNIPFDDSLTPAAEEGFASPLEAGAEDFFEGLLESRPLALGAVDLPEDLLACEEGLILAGPCSPLDEDRWCRNLARLANALGWPLLADALNPVRSRADLFDTLVCAYDFVVRARGSCEKLAPKVVIVLGSFPTSKALRSWLARMDARLLFACDRYASLDPSFSRAQRLLTDLQTQVPPLAPYTRSGGFLQEWTSLDAAAQSQLENRLSGEERLLEPKVARSLAKLLPKGAALCVSNSMPPRDMEYFFPPSSGALSLYSSRGANGIDGILSTAMGIAHRGKPTYLLTGDLALLHDSNGGLLARRLRGSLTIVLVNNSGGGIFEMLPVSSQGEIFEEYWATEQGVSFESWARLYGAAYEKVVSWSELESALSVAPAGLRVLEVQTDRKRDASSRRELLASVSQSLSEPQA